jgi:hypothetical protein
MGCAPFEDNTKTLEIADQTAAEKAPIIDINAVQPLPKSTAELEDQKQLTEPVLTTELQQQPELEQQELKAPAELWQRLRNGFEITPEKLPNAANKQLKRYLKFLLPF